MKYLRLLIVILASPWIIPAGCTVTGMGILADMDKYVNINVGQKFLVRPRIVMESASGDGSFQFCELKYRDNIYTGPASLPVEGTNQKNSLDEHPNPSVDCTAPVARTFLMSKASGDKNVDYIDYISYKIVSKSPEEQIITVTDDDDEFSIGLTYKARKNHLEPLSYKFVSYFGESAAITMACIMAVAVYSLFSFLLMLMKKFNLIRTRNQVVITSGVKGTGLQKGDVIFRVGDNEVEDAAELKDILSGVHDHCEIDVLRGRKQNTRTFVLPNGLRHIPVKNRMKCFPLEPLG